jgi:hypothetical protein
MIKNNIRNSQYSVQLVFLLRDCNLTIFIRIGILYIIGVLVHIYCPVGIMDFWKKEKQILLALFVINQTYFSIGSVFWDRQFQTDVQINLGMCSQTWLDTLGSISRSQLNEHHFLLRNLTLNTLLLVDWFSLFLIYVCCHGNC